MCTFAVINCLVELAKISKIHRVRVFQVIFHATEVSKMQAYLLFIDDNREPCTQFVKWKISRKENREDYAMTIREWTVIRSRRKEENSGNFSMAKHTARSSTIVSKPRVFARDFPLLLHTRVSKKQIRSRCIEKPLPQSSHRHGFFRAWHWDDFRPRLRIYSGAAKAAGSLETLCAVVKQSVLSELSPRPPFREMFHDIFNLTDLFHYVNIINSHWFNRSEIIWILLRKIHRAAGA